MVIFYNVNISKLEIFLNSLGMKFKNLQINQIFLYML
jgi:hypothetical protein